MLIKIADQLGNSQLGDEVFALVQANDPDTELKRLSLLDLKLAQNSVTRRLRYVGGFGNDPALRCLPFPI